MEQTTAIVHNFGRNVQFQPEAFEVPANETEVLEVLNRHRGKPLRAIGSLHSWSRIITTDSVAVSLERLQSVEIQREKGTCVVGAGCQIKRLLSVLNESGWTTPSIGLITEQTIAGATATATHGSGRHCLGNSIRSLRLATYDAQGDPVIRDITGGDELRAAQCGIGCLGIVVSIELEIRQQYNVEEHFRVYADLGEALAGEERYPLQQFYFIPWSWNYFVQHRAETEDKRSSLATLYRWYWLLGMDRGLTWITMALSRWLPKKMTPWVFRWLLPFFVPRGVRVVDRSDLQLTMQHHLYRHIETEMFVPRSALAPMLALTRWLLEWSYGIIDGVPERWREVAADFGQPLEEVRGTYAHHFPICIRKVLPDEGLISMSGGGGEAWYAVSLISYARPIDHGRFIKFADLLIQLSGRLFAARPHWGKHTPLPPPDVKRLYPEYERFLEIRDELDPTGAFRHRWMPAESLLAVSG